MSIAALNKEDFASPSFDPKKWINTMLKAHPVTTPHNEKEIEGEEDSTDITMLATRLQLMGESVSQEFDRLSTQVIRSMPHILYDLKTLSDNAKSTQKHIEKVRNNLSLVEEDTNVTLERLNRSHTVKTHMEECRAILLEESNHLEKLREEQERKRQQEEIERKAAEATAAKALEEENERKRQMEIEKEEEILRKQKEEQEKEKEEKEREEREAARPPSPDDDDALEYGHVQLPPLRQPPVRQHTFQQIQNQAIAPSDHNDSYLGSVTPQVSSVFKKIGVPLDRLWQ